MIPLGSTPTLGLTTVLLAAFPVVTGCWRQPLETLSGRVTLDGVPLDEAVVMFVPLDADRRKTGSPITGGRYRVPREVGMRPGRYRVEIVDDPPIEPPSVRPLVRPSAPAASPRRRIPIGYAIDSPLVVEVVAGGDAVFDFELTSSPSKERP